MHIELLTSILIGCTSDAPRASVVRIGGTLATIMPTGRTRGAPQATRHHAAHGARMRPDSGESGVNTDTTTQIRPDSGESGVNTITKTQKRPDSGESGVNTVTTTQKRPDSGESGVRTTTITRTRESTYRLGRVRRLGRVLSTQSQQRVLSTQSQQHGFRGVPVRLWRVLLGPLLP